MGGKHLPRARPNIITPRPIDNRRRLPKHPNMIANSWPSQGSTRSISTMPVKVSVPPKTVVSAAAPLKLWVGQSTAMTKCGLSKLRLSPAQTKKRHQDCSITDGMPTSSSGPCETWNKRGGSGDILHMECIFIKMPSLKDLQEQGCRS